MLQWWVNHRLVRPLRIPPKGFFDFDEAQCLVFGIMAELRWKGLSLDQIRKLKLKPTPAEYLADFLVTDSRVAVYCTEAELLPLVEAANRGCFVVSLKELRARLEGKPAKRKAAA
jgi:hypothetical protein